MDEFKDFHGSTVRFHFEKNSFVQAPQHVLTICQYHNQWLLTRHRNRGLEFPGGKVEEGETIEEAARREVYEETGAQISNLQFIGEYEVGGEEGAFVKAVFFGVVDYLEKKNHYHETEGPVLLEGDLLEKRLGDEFSFIMKDAVIEKSIRYIQNLFS